MRLDYRNPTGRLGPPVFFDDAGRPCPMPYHQRIRITNLDTGRELTHCIYADDLTGDWERYVPGVDGRLHYSFLKKGVPTEAGQSRLAIEFLDLRGVPVALPKGVRRDSTQRPSAHV